MSKSVLVYGGAGQLGSAVVQCFKTGGWNTISADFRENADSAKSVVVSGEWTAHAAQVLGGLDGGKVDAVVCVAGGWAGGDIAGDGIFESVDKMFNYNVKSAVVASHVAAKALTAGGLLVLTGAQAGRAGTPGMVGYGISKGATHQLVASLASEGSGLPEGATVAAILPLTLDTATNRAGMPNADFSKWTKLETVGNLILGWATGERPANGALVDV